MRKWVLIVIAVTLLLVLGGMYGVHSQRHGIHELVRERTERILKTHFESQLEFSDFEVSLFPRIHVTIMGLVMRHQGRTDIPPLFQVRQVSIYANLMSLLQPRPHVAFVQLDGLQIHTPLRKSGGDPLIQKTNEDLAKKYPVLIEEVLADDASIAILQADTNKPPRMFPIQHLVLHHLSFDQPASFEAQLTNAIPKGDIQATGEFGPWLPETPRESRAVGKYKFRNADLGTIRGLHGILSSDGSFNGPLDYLQVDGATDTPDFGIRTSEHRMALHTDFSSIVDGTNGDTYLKSVTAKFLHTTLLVSGKIIDANRELKGRTIVLDAASQHARVEDLISLAANGKDPVMTGDVSLKTAINIPEGNADLIDRLRLTGQFGIGDMKFTKSSVQGKVDTLSRKGQGQPKDMDIENVPSNMKGSFVVRDAVVRFSNLNFGVTGADITLAGTYDLDGGGLDFHGKLILQAKPSQTTTGFKSFLLKAIDPFFKGKNAGTVLAIKITGTKDNPSFGLDHRGSSD